MRHERATKSIFFLPLRKSEPLKGTGRRTLLLGDLRDLQRSGNETFLRSEEGAGRGVTSPHVLHHGRLKNPIFVGPAKTLESVLTWGGKRLSLRRPMTQREEVETEADPQPERGEFHHQENRDDDQQ